MDWYGGDMTPWRHPGVLSHVLRVLIFLEYGEHHGWMVLAPQGASSAIKWPQSASLLCDPAEQSIDLMAARTQQAVPNPSPPVWQMAEDIVSLTLWLPTNINSFQSGTNETQKSKVLFLLSLIIGNILSNCSHIVYGLPPCGRDGC